MALDHLPIDVLLNIFTQLEVNDLLAIRKTCKNLESVTRERSVWHETVSVRFLQNGVPVPGLIHRDDSLSDLSSEELERLAVRTFRFWSNWTSPQPTCHKHLEIRPTSRPWGTADARNLAAEFLPGWNGRYLLVLSLYDSSSDRENRRYSFECWDVGASDTSQPIAELLVAGLLGYAVNTVLGSPHVLAVTRRDGTNQLVTTTYTIDFDTPGVDPWFRRTSHFDSFRSTLGLQGSHFIATGADQEVRIMDVDSGRLLCSLKVPVIHNDHTLRFPEHQCLDYEIFDGFVLTFCKQWIFLYHLPSALDGGQATESNSASPVPHLDPIAKYKWRWRIDTINVNPRRIHRSPGSNNSTPARPGPIDILARFDTWYPWPVNILHHFVLPPNPTFSPSAFSPSDPATFPYLAVATADAGGPYMAHSIPSPLRLFTPSDVVLGAYGTALWLDASTDPTTPSQAGDHGQRIACMVVGPGASALASSSSWSSSSSAVLRLESESESMSLSTPESRRRTKAEAEVEAGTRNDAGSRSAGPVDLARLSAMTLDSSTALAMAADATVGVLHVQYSHELWNRVAVNEQEGQVAVGHVDGRVSVYTYAPPV